MVSIKSSLADCSTCDLLDSPSCILETNSESDLTQVDLVIVTDSPDNFEVEKGIPACGKSHQVYRQYHNNYIKDSCNWLITNCVLCDVGSLNEISDSTVDNCKKNCFEIIKKCNPKLVLLMGPMAMKAFGFGDIGITSKRGQMYKWNGFDVLITVHPSFVNPGKNYLVSEFESDIKKAVEFVGGTEKIYDIEDNGFDQSNSSQSTSQITKTGKYGIHHYKIPEKFYTDEYRLIDVQYTKKTKQIIYIFRDSKNNKVYHNMNDDYYCYEIKSGVDARKIVPYESLQQIKLSDDNKRNLNHNITYEGDMKLTAKHAMDYYHFNKGEAKKTLSNIMFLDIEIDLGLKNRAFPDPTAAKYPINLITTTYNGIVDTYLLDNGVKLTEEFPGVNLKIFKSEKQLMETFIKDFKNHDPDFLSGWNSSAFDFPYIFNRLKNIGINSQTISKYGEFYVDANYFICNLPGVCVVDQLHLYKTFNFSKRENYKLANIAQIEVKETKVELDIPFNEVYYKQLDKFVRYNIQDTILLEKLEDKLKHIHLLNEMRVICTTSFQSGSSVLGQVDTLMVGFLKSKGLGSKNGNPDIHKEKYPGAFVYEPIPGIYSNVADFDFTSLYPSLIITYNIGVNSYVMKFVDPQLGYDLTYHPENLPNVIPVIIDPMFSAHETTIKKEDLLAKIKSSNLVHTINGCFFKSHETEPSVYSEVLSLLLSSRKEYKKKMLNAKEQKDEENITLYNTKQLVYKVLANSMYGAIANKIFRFFDVSCAGAITLSGQEALKTSIFKSEEYLEHMSTGKEIVQLPDITKEEMYSDNIERRCKHIITGDTDSIFACFQKFKCDKSSENIGKLCDQLQDYLNNIVIPHVVELHNVEASKSKLFLKNELIVSRGLFLAKKRYALQVEAQEGKKVTETVYMGIEIKRSDFASSSKQFLKELLDLVLKSETIKLPQIFEFVAMKEKEFLKLIRAGDKTIARPVSYGKDSSQYKVVPQGVRAMEAWNKIMYDIHVPGTRAYMYKVMGIDESKAPADVMRRYREYVNSGHKLDVIALPDEEQKLPEYFDIDVKDSLKFCFTDRHELLLKPIAVVKKNASLISF